MAKYRPDPPPPARPGAAGASGSALPRMRLDKWLWQARFFKTRALAAEVVQAGHVRVNGQRTDKPAHSIGPGDTLTFAQGGRIRLIRVAGLPLRRGPASEAQATYLDLDAAPPDQAAISAQPRLD